MSKRKTTNRGRDLRRTETQAAYMNEMSRTVTGERGRTDGRLKQSVVTGESPKLRRKTPRTFRNASLTRTDLERLPSDATAHVDGRGKVKLVTYNGEPRERAKPDAGDYKPRAGHEHGRTIPRGLDPTLPGCIDAIDALARRDRERERTRVRPGAFAQPARKRRTFAERFGLDT